MPAVMQSKSTKRSRAQAEEKESKRSKTNDNLPAEDDPDIKAFCEQIADEDFHFDGPPEIREMLLKGIPHALKTPLGERHPYQEEVIKLMKGALDTEEQRLQGCLATAQQTVESVATEKNCLDAVAERAEVALQSKAEEVQDNENSCVRAAGVVKDSKTKLDVATRAWKDAEAAEKELANEKESIVETSHTSFDPLLAGTVENVKEQKQHISKVVALFAKLGSDVSLVGGLRSALDRKPEERGEFDNVVVNELGQVHMKYIASLDERITSAAAATAEKLSSVRTSEAELQAAEENTQKCEEALKVAQTEQQSLETDLAGSRKAVKDYAKAHVMPANATLRAARMNFKFFAEVTKSSFISLVEKTSPASADQEDMPATEAAEQEQMPQTEAL